MTVAEHSVRLPGGRTIQYEVDESVPFAVATLVYDGEHVFLTRQYRYPIGQWIFDLPGGAGEVDEEPIEAARRELEEELGLVAVDLRPLHSFYVNPGRSACSRARQRRKAALTLTTPQNRCGWCP
jgi:ADP-ribose pyrophosphatase